MLPSLSSLPSLLSLSSLSSLIPKSVSERTCTDMRAPSSLEVLRLPPRSHRSHRSRAVRLSILSHFSSSLRRAPSRPHLPSLLVTFPDEPAPAPTSRSEPTTAARPPPQAQCFAGASMRIEPEPIRIGGTDFAAGRDDGIGGCALILGRLCAGMSPLPTTTDGRSPLIFLDTEFTAPTLSACGLPGHGPCCCCCCCCCGCCCCECDK